MNQAKTVKTETGVLLEHSPVIAERIHTPQEAATRGVQTTRYKVQLRQVVKSVYPAARGNAIFEASEFGGRNQEFAEQRVCFLNVPEGVSLGQIQQRLDEMDGPKLVRVLSLRPMLSEDQLRTIENGRNPKSWEDYLEDFIPDRNDQPVLFRGEKQYRTIQFSKSWAEDVDLRADQYKELSSAAVQLSKPAVEATSTAAARI